jgi:hypothetical protein
MLICLIQDEANAFGAFPCLACVCADFSGLALLYSIKAKPPVGGRYASLDPALH